MGIHPNHPAILEAIAKGLIAIDTPKPTELPYMKVTLPWPPSGNRYYRRVGAKTLISRDGREYRKLVQAICLAEGVKRLGGRLNMAIEAYPPDNRRRDLDNLLKATLDALQHGGAYEDDSQIDWLLVRRKPVQPGGVLIVSAWTHPVMEGGAT
jgi:crossover junction endodeoxyribonuclease RusA